MTTEEAFVKVLQMHGIENQRVIDAPKVIGVAPKKAEVEFTAGVMEINLNSVNSSLENLHSIIPSQSSESFKKFQINKSTLLWQQTL